MSLVLSVCCCQYDKDTKMKANHNHGWRILQLFRLLPVRQRYKNESKSQPRTACRHIFSCCCQYDKDTKMKANRNHPGWKHPPRSVVASTTKIQKWKQITTKEGKNPGVRLLLPVRQRYKNESKSQQVIALNLQQAVVASTTKIQKWKQITTPLFGDNSSLQLLPVRQRYKNESKSQQMLFKLFWSICCCQYDKDTKMKANHNIEVSLRAHSSLLPVRQRYKNESKSQLVGIDTHRGRSCCQYDKDTKMKANHNDADVDQRERDVVASTTKIQKWKQITTGASLFVSIFCCCQYDKDTKMKANHNSTL